MKQCYFYAAAMSVVICIYMFMFYGVVIEYGDAEFAASRVYRSIGFMLSLIQLSMSLCYLYYWYVLRAWH